eukprot:CAMPEP_0201492530 /NCGR_PEP_ID=MMETSP0151_2-20130828/33541_1 /ASSEMBLY_ACC=CAM_ASM_000257 /TAXON_ID=200890 /ORGANISM="Paramoeba atlantica, Strain 621/1 / CCAP 1560/9" /LENGTH=169 /DNA_ID=CAMNT_0047879393 /DNA_START=66 /DNA_END=575 /DNA_ORIENTATION=+
MAREEGEENIHRHAKAGELWNLRAECEKHVDLDRQSAKGYTALHLAAMYGRKTCVEFLLEKGASFEITDSWGRTPVYRAIFSNDQPTLLLFLNKGCRLDLQATDGNTPLHDAVNYHRKEILKILLEFGADPDSLKNKAGFSARESGATRGYAEIFSEFGTSNIKPAKRG